MALPLKLKPKYNYNLKRLGRDNDGGYLVTLKSVNIAKTLISFGILDDCSFENDFIKINSIHAHCFDHTVGKNYWKKRFFNDIGSSLYNLNLKYLKNSLKRYQEFKNFFSLRNTHLTIETIKKGSIFKILKQKKIIDPIFLKIDIEGSEYRLLEDLIKIQNNICALIIEFHDVDLNINRLLEFVENFNLELTHIHPNNYGLIENNNIPTVLELTFEKNPDKIDNKLVLPNFLDHPNDPSSKDIKLIFEN